MRSTRERAPTRSRTRRGVKALLASLVIVPAAIGLLPGVASASQPDGAGTGSVTAVAPNPSECPGGGLKLDNINDRVIPNDTYSVGGLTIVITNSEFDSTSGVLSFDWQATAVPLGKVVSGVYIKGGTVDETELGGTSGSVTWNTPPWYSHVSFCLTGVSAPVCPGTTTVITDTTDANRDGIADMCQSFCPGTTTLMSGVDLNTDNVDDACQSFCPGTTTLMSGVDLNTDNVDDACQSFCPGTTTLMSGVDSNNDNVDDACLTPTPPGNNDNGGPRFIPSDAGEPDVVVEEEGEVLAETEVAPEPVLVEAVAQLATAEVTAGALPAPVAPAELPRTGVDTGSLLQAAAGLIGSGAFLARLGRKRSTR